MFTRRILNNICPIIYGNGQQTRDYTYVEDAVRAYDLVLNRSEPVTEPANFGSGREVSIIDIANKLIELCGKKGILEPVHTEPRIGEVQRLIADASRAKNILGWNPTVTLDDGLGRFVAWYKRFGMEDRIKLE